MDDGNIYSLPEFENLRITKFDDRHSQIDIREGLNRYESNALNSEISAIDQEISKVKNSFLKRGLNKLTLERDNLKLKQENQQRAYNKLYDIKRIVEEKMRALYEKNNLRELSKSIEKNGNPDVGHIFSEIEKDKSINDEQKVLIERHNEIQSLLKEV